MYASDKRDENQPESKAAALSSLQQALVNDSGCKNKQSFAAVLGQIIKKANSKLEHIEMPASQRPTYAGEKQIESILKTETEDEGSIGKERAVNCENVGKNIENPLLHKLGVVLAPRIQQEIENRRAEEEARAANNIPQNVNLKQYPVVNNMVPPPMGMTAPPAQPQAPQQAQQPAQPQLAAVGGGNSPNANPINSYGGLSMNGDINGNAAFGTQNAMGGEKLAAKKCSCGCGDTTVTCKCSASCSCRQKGGSCYGLKKQAAGYSAALAKIMGMAGAVHADTDDLDDLDEEMHHQQNNKVAALGLWDRIRAKKQRGEKPAKPGDKDYPDAKSWKKVTAISEKQSAESLLPSFEQRKALGAAAMKKIMAPKQKQVLPQQQVALNKAAGTPAWQRSEGKNEEGGLNEKGRKSYERETGGNLKPPVTESNPSGERAKRQNSFCSRMCGMKSVNTGASTAKDPDSRINKSLRKWNCKCGSALEFGIKMGQLLHLA